MLSISHSIVNEVVTKAKLTISEWASLNPYADTDWVIVCMGSAYTSKHKVNHEQKTTNANILACTVLHDRGLYWHRKSDLINIGNTKSNDSYQHFLSIYYIYIYLSQTRLW